MPAKTNTCSCGKPKYVATTGKVYSDCKACKDQRAVDYRARYPEKYKVYMRKTYLKYRYGMDIEDFNDLWGAQDGCCGICAKRMVVESRGNPAQACVDHDHATGLVRGLLCSECNAAIGLFHDSKVALQAAIFYLR